MMLKPVRNARRGFTLIEVLIVVAIIAICVAILGGLAVGAFFLIKALFFSGASTGALAMGPAVLA